MDNETNLNKILNFPPGFLWGTSTSAYQIEGGNINDWSEWEKSEKRIKALAKKGKNKVDYICGRACDSYNRYEEDFDLAIKLNNNAIRFGLEWSRLQPSKDTWSVEAVEHYRQVLMAAKKRGFKTVVTLWHWTNPIWLAAEGGWTNKNVVNYFSEYVSLVVKEFGGLVDFWITLNEPMVPISFGYILGTHPPGKKFNFISALKAFNNLAKAHIAGYEIIHKYFPNSLVSITSLTDYFEPLLKWEPLHIALVAVVKSFHHRRFLNKTKDYLDFIAVDYYFRQRLSWIPPFKFNKNKKTNDMGWEIYPAGIYHVLKYLARFKLPIIIAENGLADADDSRRVNFIKDHLRYVHQAIAEGVDVRGYFHWSLLDNFEWAWGWEPKFGLYAVDCVTLLRTSRPSVAVYAEICKNNSLII
jgi:beta-glucosidase